MYNIFCIFSITRMFIIEDYISQGENKKKEILQNIDTGWC